MKKVYGNSNFPLTEMVGGKFIIRLAGGEEITPNKVEFISEKGNKEILKYNDKMYFLYEHSFDYMPILDEVKDVIINHLNKKCDEEILSAFIFDNEKVYLTLENQQNYLRYYTFLTSSSLTVKVGEIDKVFTPDEYKIFIKKINKHIDDTLIKYRDLKNSISWDLYKF